MIGNTCINPEYENYLIKNKIRYEKCYSKKSKRLWLKIYAHDDYLLDGHSIPKYVKLVLDD